MSASTALRPVVDVVEGRVPPHDLAAEEAVIATAVLDPSRTSRIVDALEPSDFYSAQHSEVFRIVAELVRDGRPVDITLVASEFGDRKRSLVAAFVLDLCNRVPSVANDLEYCAIVRRHSVARRTLRKIDELRASGYVDPSGDFLSRVAEFRANETGAEIGTRRPRYVLERPDELAKPLPPLKWVCEGLRLACGALAIVGGYGYSRKTLYAHEVALSVATGSAALGVYRVRRAPVLLIDFEQGHRITRDRLQRMARAKGVNLAEADLHVVTFPDFKLTDKDARDVLRRLLEETRAGFVVVDSLKASTSGIDENAAEIREPIDVLSQEIKRVDGAGILLHHAKKPGEGKMAARYSLRGSSAIFDAAEGIFVFGGEKGAHTTVEHEKDRLIGTELDDFGINSVDVTGPDGDPRWGLKVVHLEPVQVAQAAEDCRKTAQVAALEGVKDEIRAYLHKQGGTFQGSKTSLRDVLGANRSNFFAAIGEMVQAGEVFFEGPQRDQRIRLRGTP